MAQLIVRNVDDAIGPRSEERAMKAGRSAAEYRKILEEVLRPEGRSDFFSEAQSKAGETSVWSPYDD